MITMTVEECAENMVQAAQGLLLVFEGSLRMVMERSKGCTTANTAAILRRCIWGFGSPATSAQPTAGTVDSLPAPSEQPLLPQVIPSQAIQNQPPR